MPEVPVPEEKSTGRPRTRLLWTLLGAMVLVGLLPLVISHYILIGINRDSLETLEKKYLTRSAVGIATDIQNLRQIIANNGDTFKPIWITEYGWDVDSNPNSITPAQQQSYLQQALDFLANAADNYVTIATFLIIADIYGPNNANTIMGLCDQSLSARPACSTFASYSKPTT